MRPRRDFLKLLAASSGGLLLSSCGSSSDGTSGGSFGGGSGGPNGYRFVPLINTGQTLPDGRRLDNLLGGVLINGAGQILFHGSTPEGMGLYELTPDYSILTESTDNPPVSLRKIVAQGDRLPGGEVALGIGVAVSNARRSHAVLVRHDQNTRTLYLEKNAAGLSPVAGFRTPLPILGGLRLGGIFGDLDINEQDDLLVVDHFTRERRTASGQGLFLFKEGAVGGNSQLLLSTEDLLPEAQGAVSGLGLVDLNSLGSYVAHVQGPALLPLQPDDPPAQGLVQASIQDPLSAALLAAPSSFLPVPRGSSRFTPGSSVYGARLAQMSNTVAHIVHKTRDQQALYLNGQQLLQIGDVSPGGKPVRGFSGPVLSPEGSLFGVVITEEGHELATLSRSGARVLLARGDSIGKRTVNSIVFGLHSDQVDGLGRLVFAGEFTDGSSAIVLGLPV